MGNTPRKYSPYDSFLQHVALEEHLRLVEAEIPRIIESERQRLLEVPVKDHFEQMGLDAAEYDLDVGLATRLITGSCIVSICATHESAVKRSADVIRDAKRLRLGIRDIKGDTFIKQARRYFEDVLQCHLHPPETDWGRLDVIYSLRHAFAHANGSLDEVKQPDRLQLEKYIESFQGLKVVDGHVVISVDFLKRAWGFVHPLLSELDSRTAKEVRSVM